MTPPIRPVLLCLALALLAGCATLPSGTQRTPRDPWERMNRATYKFNDAIDKAVLHPVARGYVRVVPQVLRTGVSNFFDNLGTPITMVNDLLQGQLRSFANDTGRLLLNTTLGLGGLLDPATQAGLDKNDRDLGQTLGKWGLHTGPYLVIPLLGPSDVRDAVGRVGDEFADPRHYVNSVWVRWGLRGLGAVDTRARLLPLDSTLEGAYDPYGFVRNAYLQHRDFKVSGGQAAPAETSEEDRLYQEAEQQQDAPASTAQPATPPAGTSPPPAQPPPR